MSEFGKGYSYCLGLFLAHEWKLLESKNKNSEHKGFLTASLWLYGAGDHFFELIAPPSLSQEKQDEINNFRDYVISLRMRDDLTFEKAQGFIDTAKKLLLEWDLFNGIEAEKGEWE